MKKRVILLFAVSLFLLQNTTAQKHPWEEFGYKPRVKTLSNGKYQEFHDWDTIVHIGSVIFDRHNGKILGKVENDSIGGEERMKPYVVSRWISPDPLSEEYSSWSPYNYVAGNPIKYIDPDGRKIWIYLQGNSYWNEQNNARVQYKVVEGKGGLYNEDGSAYSGNDSYANAALLSFEEARGLGGTEVTELANNEDFQMHVFKDAEMEPQYNDIDKNSGELIWNEDEGGKLTYKDDSGTTTTMHSPARILFHETKHGHDHSKDAESYFANSKKKSLPKGERKQWTNAGEKSTIKRDNEVYGSKGGVRKSHKGNFEVIKVNSPLKTPDDEK